MKCLLLGNGGREAVIAENLAKGYSLYSIMPYKNRSITEAVEKSHGKYIIGSPFDKELVKEFITKENIEMCVVNSDNLLQDGLIDLAQSLGLKTFGPTSKGAKIEWSKTYALDVIDQIDPSLNIKTFNVKNADELRKAIDNYNDCNFVVKPEGLTAGKGVKVGGDHFSTKEEGFEYAKSCLEASGNVIIQDLIKGTEFTVLGFTDGKNIVITPITYDYPYRYDADKGPGTGGMGCIGFPDGKLPFLTDNDIAKCRDIMEKALKIINHEAIEFTGVLYGGFFKCNDGLKFIEFNSRLGDPEAINVLNALETPFSEVVYSIANGTLTSEKCKFKEEYTFIVYVVSKDYAVRDASDKIEFTLDKDGIESAGAKIYFSAAEHLGDNRYKTTGNSRLFGIAATGKTYEEVNSKVYGVIEKYVPNVLDYRKDIGTIRK